MNREQRRRKKINWKYFRLQARGVKNNSRHLNLLVSFSSWRFRFSVFFFCALSLIHYFFNNHIHLWISITYTLYVFVVEKLLQWYFPILFFQMDQIFERACWESHKKRKKKVLCLPNTHKYMLQMYNALPSA